MFQLGRLDKDNHNKLVQLVYCFILIVQNRGRFGLKRAGTEVRRLILTYINLTLKNAEVNF